VSTKPPSFWQIHRGVAGYVRQSFFLFMHLSIKGSYSSVPSKDEMGRLRRYTAPHRVCSMKTMFHPLYPSIHPYPRLSAKLHRAKAPLIRDVSEFELLIPAGALSQHLRTPLPARKNIGSKQERKNERGLLTSHSWHGSISH